MHASLELIVNAVGEGICGVDGEGLTTFVNQAAANMLGYTPEELIGVPMHDVMHHTKPDGSPYPREECPMYASFKDGKVYKIDNEVLWRKDGTSFPVDYSSIPIRSDQGDLAGAVMTFKDITERRRTAEQFRLAVEAAPNGMLMANGAGQIVLVNSKMEKLFGYSREELLALSVDQLIPERYRAAHPGHRRHFSEVPQIRSMGEGRDLFALRKNGTEFPVEVGLNPIETGGEHLVLASIVDITERQRTKKKLEQAHAELEQRVQERTAALSKANQTLEKEFQARQLLSKLSAEDPNPVMRFNQAGILTYANEAAQPILQYWQCPDEGSVPVTFYRDALVQALTTLEKQTFELSCKAQTFLVDLVPIADGGYINVYGRDITDLKEVDRDLRVKNEAFYASPSGILITDPTQPDNPIVHCNPAFEQLTGYSKVEILGRNCRFLQGEDRDQEGLHILREAIAANHGCQVELRNYKKDGTLFWNELRIAPTFDVNNQVSHFVGIQTDVTARKKAEQKFRGLLEAAPDAMVIVNQEGEIVLVNAQTERLFGYQRGEVLGQAVEIFLPDRFRHQHLEQRHGYFGNPHVRSMGGGRELFARNKDGSEFPVEVSLSPLETEEGLLVSAAIRDITERKLAEKEIEMKNRDLQSLLYVTSHDLREPLRAIDNFSNIVATRYASTLDPKGQDYLQRVSKGAKRLDVLLSDILTLSRVQRMESQFEEMEAHDIIKEVLGRLDSKIQETRATIQVDPGFSLILVNKLWMTQALFNLVANALKFTREGESPEIEIRPFRPAGDEEPYDGFEVSDRGLGVSPEHADRIFQLFQRAVGREVEGTGAGLAIVRQVAERHGGRAWCECREGGGSTFTITFQKKRKPDEGNVPEEHSFSMTAAYQEGGKSHGKEPNGNPIG